MKTYITILLIFNWSFGAWMNVAAQEVRYPIEMTFKVVDDFNRPVSDAEVRVSTFHHWQPGEGFGQDINQIFKGSTDANGMVTVRGESLRDEVSYGPSLKENYYFGGSKRHRFSEVKNGRWEPWNPTFHVLMKPILKPIPMYARKIGALTQLVEIPVVSQPVGFDLNAADWVEPYGKGRVADLVFRLDAIIPISVAQEPFDYRFTVSFSNEGDGVQSVLSEPSALRQPRYAPESGYKPKLEKRIGRSARGEPLNTGTREDQNYFFRVRTVLDEQGRIKSALYGKISGDIACDVINSRKGYIIFNYYLNPTSLDRNLEFDPQNNLYMGLRRLEKINEP